MKTACCLPVDAFLSTKRLLEGGRYRRETVV